MQYALHSFLCTYETLGCNLSQPPRHVCKDVLRSPNLSSRQAPDRLIIDWLGACDLPLFQDRSTSMTVYYEP